MIAYELWPQLTRCAPLPQGLVKAQLWLWFVGMLVLSMPLHLVGLLGMPRRWRITTIRTPRSSRRHGP
jgi:cytochrome c oxidase subunit 1